MANFPFFRFPYSGYYYNYYPHYNNMNYNNNKLNNNKDTNNLNQENNLYNENDRSHKSNKNKKTSSTYNSFGPIHFANPFLQESIEEPIIEVLGIELYLDDIIILGLLFFLYTEKVQDEMLFLVLILLLLT